MTAGKAASGVSFDSPSSVVADPASILTLTAMTAGFTLMTSEAGRVLKRIQGVPRS
jgi:hypothetical protein